jgi:glycosyltransferase involved in cell wall biosynthesis
MKKILIAHQSTIPHYRIDFYNALEATRPKEWCFNVVFDSSELQKKRFFNENIDISSFKFPTVETKTYAFKYGEKLFTYQDFLLKASEYDLIVVGSALSNISYSLCLLHKFFGRHYVVWGHGKDRTVAKPNKVKRMLEMIRSLLSKNADGYMAYTVDVKNHLEKIGLESSKIFVLNNTIDILKQRKFYERIKPERRLIKQELGLSEKKILLFVGRFTKNKRIEFLLQAFKHLLCIDPDFHLLMVGSGSDHYKLLAPNQVSFLNIITDLNKLAPLYVASDAFLFPGDVGLGPLQALCYDLPIITVESPTHMPEVAYLSPCNSIILPSNISPEGYAKAINELYNNPEKLKSLRSSIWDSIRHLTIEQMAKNFIDGINTVLK